MSTSHSTMNVLDPTLEIIDPTPDIHALFREFNRMFFHSQLSGCEVKWSDRRMTLCAGLCAYQPQSGFCSIRLSRHLLSLRPRSDLVNTLLHEMIHAFLFMTTTERDHDGHGPQFQSHMRRINDTSQSRITIYHTFREEVDQYRTHWWKCDGPCVLRPPYFGVVKRSINRKPQVADSWFRHHQMTCGGIFHKIKEPPKVAKKKKAAEVENKSSSKTPKGASSSSQRGSMDAFVIKKNPKPEPVLIDLSSD